MSEVKVTDTYGAPIPDNAVEIELPATWDHEDKDIGAWFSGNFLGAREVDLGERIATIFDFANVTTSESAGEISERLGVWASAQLEQRLIPEQTVQVGNKVTILYDGLGGKRNRTKQYRVFVSR